MERLSEVVKERLHVFGDRKETVLQELLREDRDVFTFLGLLDGASEERFYREHKDELLELYLEDPELVEDNLVFAAKRNVMKHTIIKFGVEKVLMLIEENIFYGVNKVYS